MVHHRTIPDLVASCLASPLIFKRLLRDQDIRDIPVKSEYLYFYDGENYVGSAAGFIHVPIRRLIRRTSASQAECRGFDPLHPLSCEQPITS